MARRWQPVSGDSNTEYIPMIKNRTAFTENLGMSALSVRSTTNPGSEVRDSPATSVIHPKSLNSIQIRPARRVQNYLQHKLCGRTFELLRIQNSIAHGPGSPPRELFKIVIVQGRRGSFSYLRPGSSIATRDILLTPQ